jgi:aspartyl-tRNA(Asn)/glutamyl-tRNA(Gln) amidotransferase subunit A
MKYLNKSISEIVEKIKSKQIKAVDVVQESLDRIEKLNPKINAFVKINPKAIEDAKKIDEMIAAGKDPGPLAGIPVGIKDMLCTEGLETTACSNILKGFIPPYSSTVVERMKAAGAVVVGKTNCDEFAMGSSNENSCFGVVQNPWKSGYVAGGSSGGSAAAIAARLCFATIGTDTGGSIRQPASFCGVVGIKPTYGRVSRYGIIAFASSLDQAGPMANSVEDTALVLEVISGHDGKDSTSSQEPVPKWSKDVKNSLKGLKIGLPKEYFSDVVNKEIRARIDEAIATAKNAGAEIVDISLPNTEHSVSTYYLVSASEASSNLARYDGIRFGPRKGGHDLEDVYKKSRGQGFGKEVKRRIMLGTYALSSGYYDAYYRKACQVRNILQKDFLNAFEKCDVILSPVTTSPAFKIGERIDNPLEMYLNDIFTTSTNLAGLPGMSVPGGVTSEGLPVGVQLTAKHYDEQKLFNVAKCIELAQKPETRIPNGLQ